jgi:hypothetical protein
MVQFSTTLDGRVPELKIGHNTTELLEKWDRTRNEYFRDVHKYNSELFARQ